MKKKALKITLISVAVLLLVCLITLYCVAVSIYKGSFNYRCDTKEESRFSVDDFTSLKAERHTFKSNKGQTLVGYLYENTDDSVKSKGLIVFAHGLGAGGQIGYLDIFDIMIRKGYTVFAYDATANDESEGDVVGGLPQGFVDLDYAITYAETLDKVKDLPTFLLGYSWGGLSVTNALNFHREVKGVVSLAGWNKSLDLIEHRGIQMVGGFAKVLIPFASVYEFFTYGGKYSSSSSMKSFKNTDCPVMIVHGEKDDNILPKYGYDLYFEKYGDSDRFTFKKYPDRDHDVLHTDDGKLDTELFNEIATFFDSCL